jgi:hypothetical protein
MDKIKNNIEHNLPIYLIIIAVVVIFCIITFGNKNPSETVLFDTSSFNVVTSKDVLEFLDEKEARMIVIGSKKCSATEYFVPIMEISQAKGEYTINYLELLDDDPKSSEFKDLVNELDIVINYEGEEKELKEYMGSTPMIIIIKNKKIVYGTVGTISENALTQLANTYGV